MNDTFNLTRFWKYASKNYSDNRRNYLAIVAIITSLAILCQVIAIHLININGNSTAGSLIAHQMYSIAGFVFMGIMIVASQMNLLRRPSSKLITNTLPASRLEQFLFFSINATVVFYVVFFGILYLCTYLCSSYYSQTDLSILDMASMEVIPFFLGAQAGTIFALSTKIKNNYLAIQITAVLLLALFSFPLWSPSIFDTKTIEHGELFSYLTEKLSGQTTMLSYQTPHQFPKLYDFVQNYAVWVWAGVLWIAAYFKFNERQIG